MIQQVKSFVLIVAIIISGNITAQERTFKLVSNNTGTGFLKFNVDPLNFLLSQSRLTMSGQAGVKLFTGGVLLNVSGDYHYLDELAATGTMIGQSVYEPQKSRNINALLSYLIRKDKRGMIKVFLKSTAGGTGGRGVDHYAEVELDYKKYFGLEGGLKTGYGLLTYKGDALNATNFYSGSEKDIDEPFTTYLEYTWVAAGFSMGKIINAELDFSDVGLRSASYMTRFYAHILVPVSSKLEDIYYTPDAGSATKLTYRYILDKVEQSKFGFRVGYEFTPLKKIVGYGIEAGIMPGIAGGGNLYLSTKASFNFGPRFTK